MLGVALLFILSSVDHTWEFMLMRWLRVEPATCHHNSINHTYITKLPPNLWPPKLGRASWLGNMHGILLAILCASLHISVRRVIHPENWELWGWNPVEASQTMPYASLANFNVSFSCNKCEYNRFPWVLWIFVGDYPTWRWFWETPASAQLVGI